MPVPSPIKIKRDGVEYISKVDRSKYLLSELIRAALRDVGKFVRKRMLQKLKKLPGLKRAKRPYNTQFWVRKRDCDLQIGFKHNSWYGVDQELGTRGQPKRGILRETVHENIAEIRRIQGQYLSAIESENRALGLIDENDEGDNSNE
jgi:hypothetical protein